LRTHFNQEVWLAVTVRPLDVFHYTAFFERHELLEQVVFGKLALNIHLRPEPVFNGSQDVRRRRVPLLLQRVTAHGLPLSENRWEMGTPSAVARSAMTLKVGLRSARSIPPI
jgi:hypothetical protein